VTDDHEDRDGKNAPKGGLGILFLAAALGLVALLALIALLASAAMRHGSRDEGRSHRDRIAATCDASRDVASDTWRQVAPCIG
jgi:hypothetical protein